MDEIIEVLSSESLSEFIGGIGTTLAISLVPSLLISPPVSPTNQNTGYVDWLPENMLPPLKQKPGEPRPLPPISDMGRGGGGGGSGY